MDLSYFNEVINAAAQHAAEGNGPAAYKIAHKFVKDKLLTEALENEQNAYSEFLSEVHINMFRFSLFRDLFQVEDEGFSFTSAYECYQQYIQCMQQRQTLEKMLPDDLYLQMLEEDAAAENVTDVTEEDFQSEFRARLMQDFNLGNYYKPQPVAGLYKFGHFAYVAPALNETEKDATASFSYFN